MAGIASAAASPNGRTIASGSRSAPRAVSIPLSANANRVPLAASSAACPARAPARAVLKAFGSFVKLKFIPNILPFLFYFFVIIYFHTSIF